MARVLSGDALWRELRAHAKRSRRLDAAVAFIGKNPELVLRWPRECVLVTDVSERRVRTGATSAKGVSKLLRRGVQVRSLPGLHAKVYVFDEVAFVCSANASESSQSLEEAGVMLSSQVEVGRARRMVWRWSEDATPMSKPLVDPLHRLEPERSFLSSPARGKQRHASGSRAPPFLNGAGLWLDAVEVAETTQAVDKARNRVAKGLQLEEEVASAERVGWTSMNRNQYRRVPSGDWLFLMREPTRRFPFGTIEGPLRCHGGHDLGPKAGDARYSRAEYGVRAKQVALDAAAVRILGSAVTRKKLKGTPEDAQELYEFLVNEVPRPLKKQVMIQTLMRLLP